MHKGISLIHLLPIWATADLYLRSFTCAVVYKMKKILTLVIALVGFAVAIPLKGVTHACLAEECERSLCQCEALIKDEPSFSLNDPDPLHDLVASKLKSEAELHAFGNSQVAGNEDLGPVNKILKGEGFQSEAMK